MYQPPTTHTLRSPPTPHPISPKRGLRHSTLLAQAQRVLSILLRPGSRARRIANAAGRILGHVADALGRVAESASRTLEGVAEDVAEAANCNDRLVKKREFQYVGGMKRL